MNIRVPGPASNAMLTRTVNDDLSRGGTPAPAEAPPAAVRAFDVPAHWLPVLGTTLE